MPAVQEKLGELAEGRGGDAGQHITQVGQGLDLVTAVENVVDPEGTPTTISKYDYGQGDGYDALGRRTSVVNTGTAFGDAELSLWGYNDRSELASAYRHQGDDPADPGDEITAQRRLYNYDHIGNRASHGLDGTSRYYCANNLNQYTFIDDAANTCPTPPSPTDAFDYDGDGNLADDGVYQYVWDAENRLIAVAPASPSDGDKMLEFRYDYMGRRVDKTYSTYDGQGEVWEEQWTERYVYDGWNVVLVLDDNDDTLRKCTWGLDLSRDRQGADGIHGAGGIGGLLAVEETATTNSPAYWF